MTSSVSAYSSNELSKLSNFECAKTQESSTVSEPEPKTAKQFEELLNGWKPCPSKAQPVSDTRVGKRSRFRKCLVAVTVVALSATVGAIALAILGASLPVAVFAGAAIATGMAGGYGAARIALALRSSSPEEQIKQAFRKYKHEISTEDLAKIMLIVKDTSLQAVLKVVNNDYFAFKSSDSFEVDVEGIRNVAENQVAKNRDLI